MQKVNFKFGWPLVGNNHITEFLEKIISKDEVAGTYIFTGPDNLGKTTLAVFFAQILLCENKQIGRELPCGDCPACHYFSTNKKDKNINTEREGEDLNFAHGDFHLIKKEKDKKNVTIEQVRDLIRTLSMSSFLNSYKIGIIKHADSLSNEAASALLKTLEEPKEKVVIILITQDLNLIHSTIVSRSKVLNFHPVKTEIIYDYLAINLKASRSQALNFSRISLGRPALAVKFLQDKDFLNGYEKKINFFINFFHQQINERIKLINELLDKKTTGQELVRLAWRIIEVWQGVARDCLLIEYGRENIVQHFLVVKEIKEMKKNLSIKGLINLNILLNYSKELLSANVNPRIVLENIAINL